MQALQFQRGYSYSFRPPTRPNPSCPIRTSMDFELVSFFKTGGSLDRCPDLRSNVLPHPGAPASPLKGPPTLAEGPSHRPSSLFAASSRCAGLTSHLACPMPAQPPRAVSEDPPPSGRSSWAYRDFPRYMITCSRITTRPSTRIRPRSPLSGQPATPRIRERLNC